MTYGIRYHKNVKLSELANKLHLYVILNSKHRDSESMPKLRYKRVTTYGREKEREKATQRKRENTVNKDDEDEEKEEEEKTSS